MMLVSNSRIDHTDFTLHLLNTFNIQTYSDIVKFFDEYRNDRTYIAQISKIVTNYAAKNDRYALEILDQATDEMLISIIGVDKNINLKNREVGVVGSLGNSGQYFSLLKEKISKYDKNIYIHSSELDPVNGSLLEAKRQSK